MLAASRRLTFWQPDSPSLAGMLRIDDEDRARISYASLHFVGVIYAGAFDSWHRGAVHAHVAGGLSLKEPGEVHRAVRVHAAFTLQGAMFAPATVEAAADAAGIRGAVHFAASRVGPGDPASRMAFAMHEALVTPGVAELERATRVIETLGALLGAAPPERSRGSRAVRRARAYLHDALAAKVTLDDVAAHAGIDKFRLVRAFRSEVGLPPYEYLTHARVARARALLERGAIVADVAQAVGYCDESQLHRHFRRIVGMPPGRFARGPRSPKPRGRRGSRLAP